MHPKAIDGSECHCGDDEGRERGQDRPQACPAGAEQAEQPDEDTENHSQNEIARAHASARRHWHGLAHANQL